MTALLLALTLSQTPALVGPYTRLGNVNEASFLDGGSVLQGGMVFGTDAGLPYVYGGAYWSGIQTSALCHELIHFLQWAVEGSEDGAHSTWDARIWRADDAYRAALK